MSETVEVYNRPAVVEVRLGDMARVRYMDNGMVGHVPAEEVA